jgi:hypothetical protein
LVRGLPLFVSARPKTPLRVLCIMAFDTLHVLRRGRPLPQLKRQALAALLDFGACANAAVDHKAFCQHDCRTAFAVLNEAGMRSSVAEYFGRLWELEKSRPAPCGDSSRFQKVREYREAVVRLSLGMVATAADGTRSLDEGIRATDCDTALNLLFRIVMQCQIIDDVWDYAKDSAGGLPSFLTACTSLPEACTLTRFAAAGYADNRHLPRTAETFPLRMALVLVSACARLAIGFRSWQLTADRRVRLDGSPLAPKTANAQCSDGRTSVDPSRSVEADSTRRPAGPGGAAPCHPPGPPITTTIGFLLFNTL